MTFARVHDGETEERDLRGRSNAEGHPTTPLSISTSPGMMISQSGAGAASLFNGAYDSGRSVADEWVARGRRAPIRQELPLCAAQARSFMCTFWDEVGVRSGVGGRVDTSVHGVR